MPTGPQNLLAIDSGDQVVALLQGPNLLVYSQKTEDPLWMTTGPANWVGVGCTSKFVVALDGQGRLQRWQASTGEKHSELSLDRSVMGLSVGPHGDCAILGDKTVEIQSVSSRMHSIKVPSPSAVAWSADGLLLAIGSSDGTFMVLKRASADAEFDPTTSKTVSLKSPVRCVAWNTGGFWMAAAVGMIWRVDAHGKSPKEFAAIPHPPEAAACSSDGRLLAFTYAGNVAMAVRIDNGETVVSLQYLDRQIVGLAFGPDCLWTGLDSGDGNKVSLVSAEPRVARTEPHSGRERNSWVLSAKVSPVKSSDPHNPSFPGWAGPLVGFVVAGLLALKSTQEMKLEMQIPMVIGAGVCGAAAGLLLWWWDARARKP